MLNSDFMPGLDGNTKTVPRVWRVVGLPHRCQFCVHYVEQEDGWGLCDNSQEEVPHIEQVGLVRMADNRDFMVNCEFGCILWTGDENVWWKFAGYCVAYG